MSIAAHAFEEPKSNYHSDRKSSPKRDETRPEQKQQRMVTALSTITALSLLVIVGLSVETYRLSKRVGELQSLTTTNEAIANPPLIQNGRPSTSGLNTLNPFEEMQRMHEEINKMFGNSWSRFSQAPGFENFFDDTAFSPSIDLDETKDAYIVKANIPGTEKSKINVKLENDILTISGTTDEATSVKGKSGTTLSQERFVGEFSRSLSLPGAVDDHGMTTNYKDGVLTVRIPKASG